jgi:hypothetical protein
MHFGKILLVCLGFVLVFGAACGSVTSGNCPLNATILADGGAPLPPPMLVADGGAPLTPPSLMADGGAPLPPPTLVADGGAPLPPPRLMADGGAPLPPPNTPSMQLQAAA